MQRDSEVPANAVMRDVTIRGRREMIEKVKKIFQTVVQTNSAEVIMKLQSSRDGFEKMMIPNDKVGLVIGKGGAMIKALMARTVTQIQVPHDVDRDNPTLRPVIITGDSENVLEAKKLIQAIIDGQTGTLSVTGLQKVEVKGVENVDLSLEVQSHSDYMTKIRTLLILLRFGQGYD